VASLAFTNQQWPRFCAALQVSGWTEAAVRIDHCCGPMRVRIEAAA